MDVLCYSVPSCVLHEIAFMRIYFLLEQLMSSYFLFVKDTPTVVEPVGSVRIHATLCS